MKRIIFGTYPEWISLKTKKTQAKFVQIVRELISHEHFVTENTCMDINCMYIIEPAAQQI